MNYSTMPQPEAPADEPGPLLNREVRLSLKTILGAAAFAFLRGVQIVFTPSSPRDAAEGFDAHRSFVIGSLTVVAVAPHKEAALYNHHGWNGDGTCDKKTCDPDSTG